jgi:hypothetical protein
MDQINIDEKIIERAIRECGLEMSPFPDCHALLKKDGTLVRLEGEELEKFINKSLDKFFNEE